MPPLLTFYAIFSAVIFSAVTRWPCSLQVECFQ
nr:MAG TPA: hypothetical protein [Caudoviricetes sp.]